MNALRLDLGCGTKPKEGFLGVDIKSYGRSDLLIADLREPWKWEDESVDEAYSYHFLEHLTQLERCHFANELYRVLKPGGFAEIIVPHWGSGRAYGDPTHRWPPISEEFFWYLAREWREQKAQHTCELLSCDFQIDWGVSLDEATQLRNQEYQQFATRYYRNAPSDIHSTWRKAG